MILGILIYLVGYIGAYILCLIEVDEIDEREVFEAISLALWSWLIIVLVVLVTVFDKIVKWQVRMWNK
jgi:hypothetical protein